MAALNIHLFGKFSVEADEQVLDGFNACKVQELFGYLLLYRERPHAREALAGLLWGDSTTEKSKKYLRQALWHLQTALEAQDSESASGGGLRVEHDWVQLSMRPTIWLDVALFEEAYELVQGVPGRELDAARAECLQRAVELYRGDLLEGWYQDWCLYERELLQNKYLMILDKLLSYSVSHQAYEPGQRYGALILRHDRARERAHRLLMRLQYLAGDRTGALRQYERCTSALQEELGIRPDKRTVALYEQIRADHLDEDSGPINGLTSVEPSAALPEVLGRLKQLQELLGNAQQRVKQEIKSVELVLKTFKH
ncbi:MAG TPA: BTAD domain-containing putative transcriptional regulator [Pyrinomonadaceae bacterium]|jgi:DNA-binding SARP family transcriptional activator